jgi:hypothetical protein
MAKIIDLKQVKAGADQIPGNPVPSGNDAPCVIDYACINDAPCLLIDHACDIDEDTPCAVVDYVCSVSAQ